MAGPIRAPDARAVSMEIVRFIDSRLSVRIQVAPPFFVAEFAGVADDTGQTTLREWAERMAEAPEPVVVVEMGALDELSGAALASVLAAN